MERGEIIRIAREAGINFDPAGPGDDGIDTWYGNQWLPCGAIQKLIEIAQAEEREACAKVTPNEVDVLASDMPHVVWEKYRQAIQNRAATDDVQASNHKPRAATDRQTGNDR
jgi:hypothetical protein